jgi:hypothetical protein
MRSVRTPIPKLKLGENEKLSERRPARAVQETELEPTHTSMPPRDPLLSLDVQEPGWLLVPPESTPTAQ